MARHENRERAESFGAWAAAYDQHRESYPEPLIDYLLDLAQPETVLDVGCGTGKLGALFVRSGLPVTGVEPDARMAEVARSHGLEVDVAKFENWDPQGRTFDLIVAGTSWHWVDPVAGATAAASVLRPGGRLALVWHVPSRDEAVDAAINAVYRQHAPDIEALTPDTDLEAIIEPLLQVPWTEPDNATFEWSREFSADAWVDYLSTQSNHRLMTDATRQAVLDGNRHAVIDHGGTLTINYSTVVLTARLGS
ncbi:MAG: methyltransferase domain-containing protein [Acidimicrobiales bacterium]|nr:methyltransferase domain-containing protein [Acidimicrobiales bacterium]